MNTWYPDATEEELANSDNVCIICREEMQAPSTKKLPCGHIFHKNCLRSWFQVKLTDATPSAQHYELEQKLSPIFLS